MPAPHPGPPPFRPPNVGSPEREAWEDEVGPAAAYAAKKAWQKWFQDEEAYIAGQIGEGRTLEEIESPWGGGELYQNAPDKGASVFSRWDPNRIDETRMAAFQRAIGGGHFTLDPRFNLYRSGGRGPSHEGEIWRDPSGRPATAPAGAYNAAQFDYNPYNMMAQQGNQTTAQKTGVTRADKTPKQTVRTGWGDTNPTAEVRTPTIGAYASVSKAPEQKEQRTNPWGLV